MKGHEREIPEGNEQILKLELTGGSEYDKGLQ